MLAVCGMFYLPAPPPKFRAEYDPKRFPAKALKLFQNPESAERVFTSDVWGGYLIYRLYPQNESLCRRQIRPVRRGVRQEVLNLMNAQYGWEQTLATYGVDTVLLPVDTPLTGALKESQRWRPAYDDGMAIVFRSAQALARATAGEDARASASAGVAPDGRNKRGREITKSNHSDPRITKPNTRSESSMMWNFLRDEQGQDLIEYTLLLAFVALASAAMFITAGQSVSGIWTTARHSSRLPTAPPAKMSPG